MGYLPLVVMNNDRTDRNDRIAATIRHNRARGKHKVEAMSDIVIELKRRNWSDDRIGRELGMDADEVLRLCQITGLAEAFANSEFSQAWEVGSDGAIGRKMTQQDGENAYREFFTNLTAFELALQHITANWKYSCEHHLTNDRMNRIAWLGQASIAYSQQIPAVCRGGFGLLTKEQQDAANMLALRYLNAWLLANGRSEVSLEGALGRTEAELY
jgi:hypothetical protein